MTSTQFKIQFKHRHWQGIEIPESREGKNLLGREYRESIARYRNHILTSMVCDAVKLSKLSITRNPNAKSVADLFWVIKDMETLILSI